MLFPLVLAIICPAVGHPNPYRSNIDTTFWDSHWHRVERRNALYYGWTVPLDSSRCRILDFYVTGERQMEAVGRCGTTIVKDGSATYYYRSGAKSAAGQFRNGLRDGQWLYWREDGTLRLQRQWLAGLAQPARDSVAGPGGRERLLVVQGPKFLGGVSVIRYLAQTIRRPPALPGYSRRGTVQVQFVVGPLGDVTSARIVQGLAPDYDAAVLQAVFALPRWQPGRENGQAVPVRMTVSIAFR